MLHDPMTVPCGMAHVSVVVDELVVPLELLLELVVPLELDELDELDVLLLDDELVVPLLELDVVPLELLELVVPLLDVLELLLELVVVPPPDPPVPWLGQGLFMLATTTSWPPQHFRVCCVLVSTQTPPSGEQE